MSRNVSNRHGWSRLLLGAAALLAGPTLAATPEGPAYTPAAAAAPAEAARIPTATRATAQALARTALASDLALRITESLTTEVGPRLAGSDAEARARTWAVAKLTELGFDNVRVEEFDLQLWDRGGAVLESVAVTAPYPQPLFALSLGGGAATPPGGLEAEVAWFATFDDLLASDPASNALAGKLVFVNDRMARARDGAGYGPANRKRTQGWLQAEQRGAAGLLIRSVGTATDRSPHAGHMSFPGERRPVIPALAVSAADADQLERIHARGETLRIRVQTGAGWRGSRRSGNVIAEIPGAGAPEEIVVIGAHLDSWDIGTGAIDDGAGVGIVTAAARLVGDLPQRPRRTIRLVLFGAEEVGIRGALAYAAARRQDGTLADHVIGSESDFGAGKVWRLTSTVGAHAAPRFDAIARELAHLGIERGANFTAPGTGGGGPDMAPLLQAGVPMMSLSQDGTDYFDVHHTPNDTFNRIDPAYLAQNVAAWAALVWLVADSDIDFRPRAAAGAPATVDREGPH